MILAQQFLLNLDSETTDWGWLIVLVLLASPVVVGLAYRLVDRFRARPALEALASDVDGFRVGTRSRSVPDVTPSGARGRPRRATATMAVVCLSAALVAGLVFGRLDLAVGGSMAAVIVAPARWFRDRRFSTERQTATGGP